MRIDFLEEAAEVKPAQHLAEVAQRSAEACMVHAHRLRRVLRPPPAPEIVPVAAQPPQDFRNGAIEHAREAVEIHLAGSVYGTRSAVAEPSACLALRSLGPQLKQEPRRS